MMDDKQPPYVTKRLRYYNNQFLMEQDFIDEQTYHIDRQRSHDRLLHAPGIAEGLEVTRVDARTVSVTAGAAVDGLGRHLLLNTAQTIFFPEKGGTHLYMRFQEEQVDGSDSKQDVSGANRFLQKPDIFFSAEIDGSAAHVLLAEVITENGDIKSVETSHRVYAGVHLPGPMGGHVLRSIAKVDAEPPESGVSVSGNLQVMGALIPRAGNTASAGIQFPSNPGGGAADSAFIRYFADKGENAILRIGIDNDPEDTLSLWQGGDERLSIRDGGVTLKGHVSIEGGLAVKTPSLSVGGMHVVRAQDPLRIIRGSVREDKTIDAGSGFRINRGGTLTALPGVFEIEFDPVFEKPPTVIASRTFLPAGLDPKAENNWYTRVHDADTRTNALVMAVTSDRLIIKVGLADGKGAAMPFQFIAIGS
ncbi:hypothetical protein [Archangium primigenium]|uniref:hypothetical protein n=1 Tax=[Archangium] primigenium TaxID=2792470 RepID=UPI001958FAAD|nr:hypothetical protein [Archangium primigenium]MBM7116699.1 hypothetical protein [Archangium primigenium]